MILMRASCRLARLKAREVDARAVAFLLIAAVMYLGAPIGADVVGLFFRKCAGKMTIRGQQVSSLGGAVFSSPFFCPTHW